MIVKLLIHIIVVLFLFVSCHENRYGQIEHLVKQWRHKELIFPDYPNNIDDVNDILSQSNYKIVTYVDSVECTTCELRLDQWCLFLDEIKISSSSDVPFLIYSHPKNKNVLQKILEWEEFSYPVIYDEGNIFFDKNQIPSNSMFQTFLLNAKNEVVVIGNPIKNESIGYLYKEALGVEYQNGLGMPMTAVNVDKEIIDFETFPLSQLQTAEIVLLNLGDNPLIVPNIISSCNCVKVEYDKQPVEPGEKLSLKVSYHSDRKGSFRKILNIYCNVKRSPLQVKIYGRAE